MRVKILSILLLLAACDINIGPWVTGPSFYKGPAAFEVLGDSSLPMNLVVSVSSTNVSRIVTRNHCTTFSVNGTIESNALTLVVVVDAFGTRNYDTLYWFVSKETLTKTLEVKESGIAQFDISLRDGASCFIP